MQHHGDGYPMMVWEPQAIPSLTTIPGFPVLLHQDFYYIGFLYRKNIGKYCFNWHVLVNYQLIIGLDWLINALELLLILFSVN